jgi:hypothetical protein
MFNIGGKILGLYTEQGKFSSFNNFLFNLILDINILQSSQSIFGNTNQMFAAI